jgi:hypothetical protein
MTTCLLAILQQIHQAEAEGILADLLAPQQVEKTGDEEVDARALEEAWSRHRFARRDAERLLQRNRITAQVAKNDEQVRRLSASVAGKLGEFKRLAATVDERRARARNLVLPASTGAITVEAPEQQH